MAKNVSAVKARQQLGSLLNEVKLKGASIVIERDGKPMAALVPLERYEEMERRRNESFDRLEQLSERIRERRARIGKSDEELQEDIDRAASDVRGRPVKTF